MYITIYPPKFTLKYINYTMDTLAFNLADAQYKPLNHKK